MIDLSLESIMTEEFIAKVLDLADLALTLSMIGLFLFTLCCLMLVVTFSIVGRELRYLRQQIDAQKGNDLEEQEPQQNDSEGAMD